MKELDSRVQLQSPDVQIYALEIIMNIQTSFSWALYISRQVSRMRGLDNDSVAKAAILCPCSIHGEFVGVSTWMHFFVCTNERHLKIFR